MSKTQPILRTSVIPPRPGSRATGGTEGGAPSRTAIVLVTALVGVFGAIPATIQARKAASAGYPTRPYWKAFWVTFAISVVVYFVVLIGIYLALFAFLAAA